MNVLKWMGEKLRPCPMCNKLPTVYNEYQHTGSGDGRNLWYVECNRHPNMTVEVCIPGPHGYVQKNDIQTDKEALDHAIWTWNHEVNSSGKVPNGKAFLGEANALLD